MTQRFIPHPLLRRFALGLFAFLGFCGLGAHAQPQEHTINNPLGLAYVSPAPAHADLARLTFYRAAGAAVGVASLHINDRYQASLQPGGYTELCMKPSVADVGAMLQINGQPPKELPDTVTYITLKPGDNLFVRVLDLPKGQLSLVPVSAEVAYAELQKTRRQVHSISRVPGASACDRVTGSPAPKTMAITFNTDALFQFGRADVAAILPYGREQLDRLAQRITTRYADFEHSKIQVIGHADPIGNPIANQTLSEARATAVRDYLVTQGVSAERIDSQGRGAHEPLDKTCGALANPVSIACNKVNRRVVVEMTVRMR